MGTSTFLKLTLCVDVVLLLLLLFYFPSLAKIEYRYIGSKTFYEEKCRHDWLVQYSLLHERMERHEISPRYLIFVPPPTGISDKLFAFNTAFYLAYLSKRALKVAANEYGKIMMDSFEPRTINLYSNYSSDDYFRCWDDGILTPKLNQTLKWIFGSDPLVAYMSNRGNTFKLFNNNSFAEDLMLTVADPRYAVYCGLNFLLKPKHEVILEADKFVDQFHLANADIVRIGIHVRTGDETIQNNHLGDPLEKYSYAFECAKKLEALFVLPGKKVLWFVISDSLEIRRHAMASFGDKVITDTNNVAKHSSYGGAASHQIVSSILAFSLCDYFVIDVTSGVGKLAAWLSHARERTNFVYESRTCSAIPDATQAGTNQGV